MVMLKDLWLVLTGRISEKRTDELRDDVVALRQIIAGRLQGIEEELLRLRADLVNTFNDPSTPKGYEAHRALSDQLGAKMQAKLVAEDKARRHTTGEL